MYDKDKSQNREEQGSFLGSVAVWRETENQKQNMKKNESQQKIMQPTKQPRNGRSESGPASMQREIAFKNMPCNR